MFKINYIKQPSSKLLIDTEVLKNRKNQGKKNDKDSFIDMYWRNNCTSGSVQNIPPGLDFLTNRDSYTINIMGARLIAIESRLNTLASPSPYQVSLPITDLS